MVEFSKKTNTTRFSEERETFAFHQALVDFKEDLMTKHHSKKRQALFTVADFQYYDFDKPAFSVIPMFFGVRILVNLQTCRLKIIKK